MKAILYTKHAKKQMKDRGITEKEVVFCSKNPDKIDQQEGIMIIKRRKEKYVYILIGKEENNSFKLITVYKSSKIKKYLN